MEVYLDQEGKLTCSVPDSRNTAADLAVAVERFCQENITCTACSETCCAGFVVYADNVFLAKLDQLLNHSGQADDNKELLIRSMRLDTVSRKWFVPQRPDGKCQYLSRQGRCLIYEIRPLVCRLHVCCPAEAGYRQLKDDLYFAYHEALKVELSRLIAGRQVSMPDYWISPNPIQGMEDYNAVISEIRAWTKATRIRMEQINIRLPVVKL